MSSVPTALEAALAGVKEAIAAGEVMRAADLAAAALDSGLEHPLLLNLRAHAREQAGRLQDALDDLERAQGLAPADPQIANARGLCLARLGRMPEAVQAFGLCVRVAPSFAPAHFNLAWANETVGDLAAAGDAYRQAIDLAPDHAEAWAGLAYLSARRGDAAETRRLAERALALRPGLMKAVLALAQAELGARDFVSAESRLRQAITEDVRQQGPQLRAIALGLLADALDGQGRIDEAFAAYQAENALTREINAATFAGPGVGSVPAFLAWVTDYFEHTPPDKGWRSRSPVRSSPAATHVFMVGFPRSGTTLLENALAGAPEVATVEEREFLVDGVRAFMTQPKALDRLATASASDLEPFRESYWRKVREFGVEPGGRVFIDKLPLNTFKLPLIVKLFPQAKVIFSVRDPRDVVLSCFRRHFAMNPAMFEFLTLAGTARLYDATFSLFAVYRQKLGVDAHMVRYEDLVDDFETTTRAACAFMGIAWSPDLAGFAERARNRGIATPSATQVASGLYRQGVGQWRPYRTHLAPVMPLLEQWVTHFAYPAD